MYRDRTEQASMSSLTPDFSFQQILKNVREIRPLLQERGSEIEELRRIPDDILKMLRETGAFRMMMPRSWGGPELNPMQINEVLEELAMGNASVAWCVMIQTDTGLYSAFLEDGIAREIYPQLDMTTSNVIRGMARAQKVDGGYVVNGRWSFASGCLHTDWFAGGCFILEKDGNTPALNSEGKPLHQMVLAKREDFIIHDTWYTTGLSGTGSNDIEAKDLFIPTERVFSFDKPIREGALYQWPAMLSAKMPGVALGIARNAIETVTAIMHDRQETSERVALAIADAQTLYASARAYVHGSLEVLWERLEAGELPNEKERVAVFLARANAFQASRTAVQLMFDVIGGGAIYVKKSPMERHLRDINTACQHIMAQRKAQQAAGELMLDVLETTYPFL